MDIGASKALGAKLSDFEALAALRAGAAKLAGSMEMPRQVERPWKYLDVSTLSLDGYAPGLREGQRLRRGDPIGRVGSTGNASPEGPHLHFAIHRMGPTDRWWQGRAGRGRQPDVKCRCSSVGRATDL